MKKKKVDEILIVEDDIDLQEILKLLFEEEGNVVHVASNKSEALKYMDHDKPFIALVDVNLPDGRGDMLVSEIRINPNLKTAVLMSARDDVKKLAERINAEYVYKPFNFDELLKKTTIYH